MVTELRGPSRDEGRSVAADDTGVYVAGITTDMPGEPSYGAADGFVRRLTAEGRRAWTTTFSSADDDLAFDVALRPRAVHVTGWTQGALPGERLRGWDDAFVQAIGRAGGLRHAIQFGTGRQDQAWAISADAGSLTVVGGTNGRFHTQDRFGGQDAFARRYLIT